MNLDLIIEPEELEAVMDDPGLMIVDVSQPQTYQQLHIPGAVHVNPADLTAGTPPATGKLPPVEKLTAVLGGIGYSPQKHIVVYDDEGGGWAGRFIWTLDVIGHTGGYSYLNGGISAWYREGHPVDAEPEQPEPSDVSISIDRSVIADMNEVLASLDDDNVKIWDARSAGEYTGTKISAMRGGHIPGALNLDWLRTMDRDRNLRLLPRDELQHLLDGLGFERGNEIITHCQTHHRSGLTYLIAKALGYRVKAYDGSWSEWGNSSDTPVVTGESPGNP